MSVIPVPAPEAPAARLRAMGEAALDAHPQDLGEAVAALKAALLGDGEALAYLVRDSFHIAALSYLGSLWRSRRRTA
jgi:hypothetical protein